MSILFFMTGACLLEAAADAIRTIQNRPKKPHVYRKADR